MTTLQLDCQDNPVILIMKKVLDEVPHLNMTVSITTFGPCLVVVNNRSDNLLTFDNHFSRLLV